MAVMVVGVTYLAAAASGYCPPLPGHAHLWSLPDGTGLHAPYGQLVIDSATGRVCCHLCGQWFVSLGGHLRRHGHTARSYREMLGLCRRRPLVAVSLSESIAARQSRAYRRCPQLRARLAVGQQLAAGGQLTALARASGSSPERVRLRRAALDAGRMTRAVQRDRALARRLREFGFDDLASYLRHARGSGLSLRRIAQTTGLGWARLQRELVAAGLQGPGRDDQRSDGQQGRHAVATIAG